MRRVAVLVVLLAVFIAGCGSDPPDLAPGPTVQRWLDDNDCAVLTDDYDNDNADLNGECGDTPYEGLRPGDYSIADAAVNDDRATVTIRRRDGMRRSFSLVQQDGRWRIDDDHELPDTAHRTLGDPVLWIGSYANRDGRPFDVRLIVTPVSIDDDVIRVRLRNASSAALPVAFGERFLGIVHDDLDVTGSAYEPDDPPDTTLPPQTERTYALHFAVIPGQRLRRLRFQPVTGEAAFWDLTAR